METQNRLRPHLSKVALPANRVLYESGATIDHVYFPTTSIVSLRYVMQSGVSGEVAVVGSEGVVGFALFMGGGSTESRAVVQSAGCAYRLPVQRLNEEFKRHGDLLSLMLRYTQALITQMSQMAVCNRHHTIGQQLCRWLLLSLDRRGGNELNFTHEFIASMLGVRREGVTDAASKLQKLNIIAYHRGKVTILDRAQLERLCCECYCAVKNETDRLLYYTAPSKRPEPKLSNYAFSAIHN